ncbi:unnamed protein product [Rotaria magnacalcarata]
MSFHSFFIISSDQSLQVHSSYTISKTMENTDSIVQQQEEVTPLAVPVAEDKSKTNDEQPVVAEDKSKTNDEQPVVAEDDASKTSEEQIVSEEPATTTTTTSAEPVLTEDVPQTNEDTSAQTTEEASVPTDEQENVTDNNAAVASTSVSPTRSNEPLKEVNESEKDESAALTNGAESTTSKKRELEQEEGKADANNDDERSGDQTKKIKIGEDTDTPIVDSKEFDSVDTNLWHIE